MLETVCLFKYKVTEKVEVTPHFDTTSAGSTGVAADRTNFTSEQIKHI